LVLAGYANVLPNNGTLDQLIATYPDNPEIGYLIPAMHQEKVFLAVALG
jgi:hypothetical protein